MYKKAILHFKKSDPILYQLSQIAESFELTIHPDPYLRLVRSIVGQQLSVKAASTIFGRFEKLFPKNHITPKGLIKIPDERLKEVGLSRQKISYLKDLSEKVLKGELELEKFGQLDSEIITMELIKVKGIGQWTAEMFLMFSLGKPDIFSYGDIGLQNAIKKAYKLKTKPTLKQMEKIVRKWVPFRTYAAFILWRSLDNQP